MNQTGRVLTYLSANDAPWEHINLVLLINAIDAELDLSSLEGFPWVQEITKGLFDGDRHEVP